MTLWDALFGTYWAVDRFPFVESEEEYERDLGRCEPFAFERVEPGFLLVLTRRRLTMRERMARWLHERNAAHAPERTPETEEPGGESDTESAD